MTGSMRGLALAVAALVAMSAPSSVPALVQDGNEGIPWLGNKVEPPPEPTPLPPGVLGISVVTPVKVCFRKTGTKDKDRQGNAYKVDYTPQELVAQRELVKDTLLSSWGLWTNLIFMDWSECPRKLDGYLYIDLIKKDCGGCGDALPRGYSPKGVRVWLMNENPDVRLLRSTIIHEVGHALGFHHEMDRPDAKWPNGSWICNDGPVEHPQGIPLTRYYDDVSIMNYCSPPNRNGLSFGDIEGAQKRYGTSNEGTWLKALPVLSLYAL